MPRAQKLPHQVVDARNGGTLDLATQPDAVVVVPEHPEGLRKAGKEAWVRYWTSPMAQLATDADVTVVERYAKAVDEWAIAAREFSKQRTVEGSQGQVRINPLGTWIQSREAVLVALEDRLGLSPLARMKLGVAVGEAHKSLADMNARLLDEVRDGATDDEWTFD